MSSPAVSPAPAGNLLHRFRRNGRGSAAVEFALVAPVFFALLFAIIEVATHVLCEPGAGNHHAEFRAQILTGQAQNAAFTQAQFKALVCSQIPALFNCGNDICRRAELFRRSPPSPSTARSTANKNFINNMQYNPGGPGDIVVVRLFYQWPLFVTGLGYNISNLSGSQRLLTATAAFRNEPY